MNKSLAAIQLAINYIKNDNIPKLDNILSLMPLEKMDSGLDTLLSTFLSVATKYNRSEPIHVVIDNWKNRVYFVDSDKINTLSRLFVIKMIDLQTLAFVVSVYDDFTYVELMDDLIQLDSSPEIVAACNRADLIFGIQLYTTYQIIVDHADEFGNLKVKDYAIARLEEVAPYADKPEYVKNYLGGELKTDEELVPNINESVYEIPSDEEAVELLTAGLAGLGISIDDVEKSKEFLLKKLSISTKEEKIKLLEPVLKNKSQELLSGNLYLFRLYGPANPLVNQNLTLPGKSNMYGGCRMFLCDVFDYDEEFDYYQEWFTGVCEQCHKRIREYWYAVRKPGAHGGWKGCFCSWKCVNESMYLGDSFEEPDILVHKLINIFEKQINDLGIQDRYFKKIK